MEPTGDREIRLGFIGTGEIASHHMKRLGELGGIVFAAHWDAVAGRAKDAAAEFGGEAYSDRSKLLDRDDLDAVYLCASPEDRGDIEEKIVARKLPMFVAHPVMPALEKARSVAAAAEKVRLLTCLDYPLRYTRGAWQAERVLADRGGDVGMAVAAWRGCSQEACREVDAELSRSGAAGGLAHLVDFLRGMMGDIVQVQAVYSYRFPDGVDASAPGGRCVILSFASGAVGTVTSALAPAGKAAGPIEFIFRNGSLLWEVSGCSAVPSDAMPVPEAPSDLPRNIDEAFVRALRSGDESFVSRTSYSEGVRTLEAVLAADISAAECRPVRPAWL